MRPKVRPLPPLPTGGRRTAKPCHNRPPGGGARDPFAPPRPLLTSPIETLRLRHESGGSLLCQANTSERRRCCCGYPLEKWEQQKQRFAFTHASGRQQRPAGNSLVGRAQRANRLPRTTPCEIGFAGLGRRSRWRYLGSATPEVPARHICQTRGDRDRPSSPISSKPKRR